MRKWEYIEWTDAFGPKDSQRISKERLAEIVESCDVVCCTAGCVVHESGIYVTIVNQVWDTTDEGEVISSDVGAYMRIPKSLIRKRIEIPL